MRLRNYRFLKDEKGSMRRMNCMRRWRILEDNIVSLLGGILSAHNTHTAGNSKLNLVIIL